MIELVRLDERLLHGQVAVKWLTYTKTTDVLIIDDRLAANPMLAKLFTSMTPHGTKVTVCSIRDAAAVIRSPELSGPACRLFIVTKLPSTALKLLDEKITYSKLNIGNMNGVGGKQIFKCLFANEEDKTQLKEIMSRGVDVFYQEIPDVGRKDLAKILK